MRLGTYKVGRATLEAGVPDVDDAALRHGVVELTRVYVPPKHRRRGHGADLMRHVCRVADMSGKVLLVHVAPFDAGGPNRERLVQWYRRFGFALIQPEPLLMARPANVNRNFTVIKPEEAPADAVAV